MEFGGIATFSTGADFDWNVGRNDLLISSKI